MSAHELELDLDAFEGPFDLLLTLVLREELEPAEVDVAAIVVAFVERLSRPWPAAAPAGQSSAPPTPGDADGAPAGGPYFHAVPPAYAPSAAPQERERDEWDLDVCGEFLVLISALLELKARALFPDEEAELAELEPEEAAEELARRLAEYRRMKEAAAWLSERLGAERDRFFRVGPAPLAPRPERTLAPQDPAQLGAVLRALAEPPPQVSLAHMPLRFPPVSQFLERFRQVLRRRTRFDLDAEIGDLPRIEQAVAFLALLELRKTGEIALDQPAPFARIRVSRPDVERTAEWTVRSA